MAQTMELSLDVQSPIQVSNKTASSVITLSFARVGTPPLRIRSQLILLCGSAILFKSKSLEARRGKKVIDKNFLPFPSWRNHYWQD